MSDIEAIAKKIESCKKLVNDAEKKRAFLQGKMDLLKTDMKTNFNVDSIEEAQKLQKEIEIELEDFDVEINTLVNEIDEKLGDIDNDAIS